MSTPALSILVPTYNRSALLRECLDSVLRQSFSDYEVIVSDDCSPDDTEPVVKAMDDSRIYYYRNAHNLGYGHNLQAGASHARGEILFLLGHDDILLSGALERTVAAFASNAQVGLVTRPYYWFTDDPRVPVRVVAPPDTERDTVWSLRDGQPTIRALFTSAGQLSGLAFRRSMMRVPFHRHIFTAHIYPFADILKRAQAVYLRDYTVAVRIESSMTRHKPDIYVPSPTQTWIDMFKAVYAGEEHAMVRRLGIDFISSENFVGLVQLRNYANTGVLLNEIGTLARARPRNLLEPKFWFYTCLSLFTPAFVLTRLADAYKRHILAHSIRSEAVTRNLYAA